MADLGPWTLATSSTSYLQFSMTKIVTTTAVMRLAETGSLDLDNPVSNYFPDHDHESICDAVVGVPWE